MTTKKTIILFIFIFSGIIWANSIQAAYGVWLDTTPSPDEFLDWAWSDMIVGWLSFNCKNQNICGTSNYKVMANLAVGQAPNKPANLSESWNHCLIQGESKVILSWQYSDPDGGFQDSYQVLIDNDSDFSSLTIDSCNPSLSGGVNTCQDGNSATSYMPLPSLSFGATYYWKVKVKDVAGNWSVFSDSSSFATPSHAYPYPKFVFSPSNPSKEELVQFTNQTTWYGISEPAYSWDFGDGSFSSMKDPTHSYLNTGAFTVRLTATDDVGFCEETKTLRITLPIPEWKEILPF